MRFNYEKIPWDIKEIITINEIQTILIIKDIQYLLVFDKIFHGKPIIGLHFLKELSWLKIDRILMPSNGDFYKYIKYLLNNNNILVTREEVNAITRRWSR
jgi:Holliday junction resolvase